MLGIGRREFITLLAERLVYACGARAAGVMFSWLLAQHAPDLYAMLSARTGKVWLKPAMSRAATSQSTFGGRKVSTRGCRPSPGSWSIVG